MSDIRAGSACVIDIGSPNAGKKETTKQKLIQNRHIFDVYPSLTLFNLPSRSLNLPGQTREIPLPEYFKCKSQNVNMSHPEF